MTITEMKDCIEKMRECYKFDDDHTKIMMGDPITGTKNSISLATTDVNGTFVELHRNIELKIKF